MRRGSGTSSLARFLSSASWSLAPGPCEAPAPVTILTFPCQDGFCSRAGPLSARSMDGTARFSVWRTAAAAAWAGSWECSSLAWSAGAGGAGGATGGGAAGGATGGGAGGGVTGMAGAAAVSRSKTSSLTGAGRAASAAAGASTVTASARARGPRRAPRVAAARFRPARCAQRHRPALLARGLRAAAGLGRRGLGRLAGARPACAAEARAQRLQPAAVGAGASRGRWNLDRQLPRPVRPRPGPRRPGPRQPVRSRSAGPRPALTGASVGTGAARPARAGAGSTGGGSVGAGAVWTGRSGRAGDGQVLPTFPPGKVVTGRVAAGARRRFRPYRALTRPVVRHLKRRGARRTSPCPHRHALDHRWYHRRPSGGRLRRRGVRPGDGPAGSDRSGPAASTGAKREHPRAHRRAWRRYLPVGRARRPTPRLPVVADGDRRGVQRDRRHPGLRPAPPGHRPPGHGDRLRATPRTTPPMRPPSLRRPAPTPGDRARRGRRGPSGPSLPAG